MHARSSPVSPQRTSARLLVQKQVPHRRAPGARSEVRGQLIFWFFTVTGLCPPERPQKFRAVWAWPFPFLPPPPSPEAPPSWRRWVRMLRRRWWTPLLRPPSPPLSWCVSSPAAVSEHSCTARCSSTCRATGEHQSPDVTLRERPPPVKVVPPAEGAWSQGPAAWERTRV